MAELKTKANDGSVEDFINQVEDPTKRADCKELVKLMGGLTDTKPVMWGDSIVGFGRHTYKYASGRTGEWMQTAFSPRKQNITLYIMDGFTKYDNYLDQLGKHKTGKSCLYVKRLSDIDMAVLENLIIDSVEHLSRKRK